MSFVAAPSYVTGGPATAIAVGDLNGDGRADLAVASAASGAGASNGSLSVLLADGHGTWGPAVVYQLGAPVSSPSSVALGDVNGDGKTDLVVGSRTGALSVLFNEGGGRFAPAVNDADEHIISAVALGDVNGDGKLDLAVAREGYAADDGQNVGVFLNNGDGAFAPSIDYAAGVSPSSLVFSDLNDDGHVDLVFGSRDTVGVLLNRGDGTFAAAVGYAAGSGPVSVAVGDLNGDGAVDVVAAKDSITGDDSVSVLLNHGDGTFASTVDSFAGAGQASLVVGDWNDDGQPDVAVTTLTVNGGEVHVLLNDGHAMFAAGPSIHLFGRAGALAVGDLSADGKPDLAVGAGEQVSVIVSRGNGTFVAAPSYGQDLYPQAVAEIAAPDLNGDGAADLILANGALLANDGHGAFAPVLLGDGERLGGQSVAAGDLNGDGTIDLAFGRQEGGVSVFTNVGPPVAFSAGVTYATGRPMGTAPGSAGSAGSGAGGVGGGVSAFNAASVALGDLNGDDRLDLAVANLHSDDVSVLLNAGNGRFAPAINYPSVRDPASVIIGDLNGDGKSDLVVLGSGGGGVFLNEGDGTFRPGTSPPGCSSGRSGALEDLNGDGKVDLVVATALGVIVLPSEGDGTFGPPIGWPIDGAAMAIALALGDLNGDRKVDLAVVTGSGAYVLLNRGNATFVDTRVGLGGSSAAITDLNGDGRNDLVVGDTDRQVTVLLQASTGLR